MSERHGRDWPCRTATPPRSALWSHPRGPSPRSHRGASFDLRGFRTPARQAAQIREFMAARPGRTPRPPAGPRCPTDIQGVHYDDVAPVGHRTQRHAAGDASDLPRLSPQSRGHGRVHTPAPQFDPVPNPAGNGVAARGRTCSCSTGSGPSPTVHDVGPVPGGAGVHRCPLGAAAEHRARPAPLPRRAHVTAGENDDDFSRHPIARRQAVAVVSCGNQTSDDWREGRAGSYLLFPPLKQSHRFIGSIYSSRGRCPASMPSRPTTRRCASAGPPGHP